MPEDKAGVLLVDKPAGVTSHDVVAGIRRELGRKTKVGHAGTLDPFATGLLLILIGRATRLQRYLLGLPKTYEATAHLGWTSTTGDRDGELTHTGKVPDRLELPTGIVRQRVPMTSAVRVEGERLYKRAHRGETIETPEREVHVYAAELMGETEERAKFRIECSAGTYIRTLVETLEDAYCEELRRIAIGPLKIEAVGAEPLSSNQALSFLSERELDDEEADRVSHGVAVEPSGEEGDDPVRLTHAGELVAVGRVEEGKLRTEVVLRPSP